MMLGVCLRLMAIRNFNKSMVKVYYFVVFCLFFGYVYLMINFPLELYSWIIVPATCFTFQSLRNYRLRGTCSKVYYSYYLGIMTTQIVIPLYDFACPSNIFLIEPSYYKSLIWVGSFIVGVS